MVTIWYDDRTTTTMKIGILTQPLQNNYGGLLQNYALQQVLKGMGHEVETIDHGNKNKGQILLRYHTQRGLIPIPKSTDFKRLTLNISVFDFNLTPDEMTTLSGFNKDKQYLPESKGCPGF